MATKVVDAVVAKSVGNPDLMFSVKKRNINE